MVRTTLSHVRTFYFSIRVTHCVQLPAQTKRREGKDTEEESENPVDWFLEVFILLFITLVKTLKQPMIDLTFGRI